MSKVPLSHPHYFVRDRANHRIATAGYFAELGTGLVIISDEQVTHTLTVQQAQGLVVRLLLAIADAQGGDDV